MRVEVDVFDGAAAHHDQLRRLPELHVVVVVGQRRHIRLLRLGHLATRRSFVLQSVLLERVCQTRVHEDFELVFVEDEQLVRERCFLAGVQTVNLLQIVSDTCLDLVF